jgi:hypothetical protein
MVTLQAGPQLIVCYWRPMRDEDAEFEIKHVSSTSVSKLAIPRSPKRGFTGAVSGRWERRYGSEQRDRAEQAKVWVTKTIVKGCSMETSDLCLHQHHTWIMDHGFLDFLDRWRGVQSRSNIGLEERGRR